MTSPDRYAVQVPASQRGGCRSLPDEPTPVTVTMRWEDRTTSTGHRAWVRCWSETAVECVVEARGSRYKVWLPRGDVQRTVAGARATAAHRRVVPGAVRDRR